MSWKFLVAGAAVFAACSARAENVDLVGKFAAKSREVASLNSIAVDRFAGHDGPRLSIALERALLNGNGNSPPHFRVITDSYAADGDISGVVSTDVREVGFQRRESWCAQREPNNKCVRDGKVDVPAVAASSSWVSTCALRTIVAARLPGPASPSVRRRSNGAAAPNRPRAPSQWPAG